MVGGLRAESSYLCRMEKSREHWVNRITERLPEHMPNPITIERAPWISPPGQILTTIAAQSRLEPVQPSARLRKG